MSVKPNAIIRCSSCGVGEMVVATTRGLTGQNVIRRRRKCERCEYRVTTYERIGESDHKFNPDLPVHDGRSVRVEAIRLLAEIVKKLDPDEALGREPK